MVNGKPYETDGVDGGSFEAEITDRSTLLGKL